MVQRARSFLGFGDFELGLIDFAGGDRFFVLRRCFSILVVVQFFLVSAV